jgi:hypothetical protein
MEVQFLQSLKVRQSCGGSSFWIVCKWWDHKSEKVTEHQFHWRVHHANGASVVFAFSWLLSYLVSNLAEIIFRSFAEGGHSSNRLEKVGECNLIMEKVSEAFFHVLIEYHLCL